MKTYIKPESLKRASDKHGIYQAGVIVLVADDGHENVYAVRTLAHSNEVCEVSKKVNGEWRPVAFNASSLLIAKAFTQYLSETMPAYDNKGKPVFNDRFISDKTNRRNIGAIPYLGSWVSLVDGELIRVEEVNGIKRYERRPLNYSAPFERFSPTPEQAQRIELTTTQRRSALRNGAAKAANRYTRKANGEYIQKYADAF